MGSVKAWRGAAIGAAVLAVLAIVPACLAIVVTESNLFAVERLKKKHNKAVIARQREIAGSIRGISDLADVDIAGPVNWSRVARRVLPSTVNIEALPHAPAVGEIKLAWLVPGTRKNFATDLLDQVVYRSWIKKFEENPAQWSTVGAGVFIDGRYVLTAAHVIDGRESFQIQLATGEFRFAQVVGLDTPSDIGVLRIEGEPGPSITPKKSAVRQGEAIMAVGAPAGNGFSVSTGIVSRLAGSAFSSAKESVQIDAAIIGGSSGGPVVDASGEDIGVLSHGNEQFSQAVPIGLALQIAGKLIDRDRLKKDL